MTTLAGADVTLAREGYHHVTRYLSPAPKVTVFRARINGTPSTDSVTLGVYQFNFDTVTTGAYTDVQEGMTLTVGTSSGADDIGTVRVRKAPTSTIMYIAETPRKTFAAADDHYITVYKEYRPWIKPPRLVGVKAAGKTYTTSFTEYHDYDFAYVNENTNIQPKAIITQSGTWSSENLILPKPAGFVDGVTGYRDVDFDSSNSFAIATGASISSRTWDLDGGAFLVGTSSSAAITARFDPGFYYVKLTVTDSLGTTGYVRFPIWAHEDGTFEPYTAAGFTITNDQRGDYRTMGFDLYGQNDSADTDEIPEGTLVCYWEDATWGAENDTIPSAITSFFGWTTEDSTLMLANDKSKYTFTVAGLGWWAEQFRSFSQVVTDTGATAAKWHQMRAITTRRVIFYILYRYTNFLNLAGLFMTDFDNSVKKVTVPSDNVMGQLKEMAKTVCAEVGFDSHGNIWILRHFAYLESADRSGRPSVMTVTSEDVTEAGFTVTERMAKNVYIESVGSTYSSGKDILMASRAPGVVPAPSATKEPMPFQYLPTTTPQVVLNQLTGHHYARTSEPTAEISLPLIGNYDFFEPAWREPITLTYTDGSMRGTGVSGSWVIKSVAVQHNNEFGQPKKMVTLTVEQATLGAVGETHVIPKNDSMQFDSFDFGAINFNIGDLAVGDFGSKAGLDGANGTIGLIFGHGGGLSVWTTTNFNNPSHNGGPTWTEMTVTGSTTGRLESFCVDAFSPRYVSGSGAVNGWFTTEDSGTVRVYYLADIFGSPTVTLKFTSASLLSYPAASNNSVARVQIQTERATQNFVVASWYTTTGVKAAYTTDNSTWTEVSVSANTPSNPPGGGVWLEAGPPVYVSRNASGKAVIFAGNASSDYVAHVTSNTLGSFSEIAAANADLSFGQTLHFPIQNNSAENLFYFCKVEANVSLPFQSYWALLMRYNNGVATNISPRHPVAFYPYGPIGSNGCVATSDGERNTLAMCGQRHDGNGSYNAYALWVTQDAMSVNPTWRLCYDWDTGSDYTFFSHVALTGPKGNQMYLWGPRSSVAYSGDFGLTIDSRRGNFAWGGAINGRNIIGLVGG